MDFQKLVVKIAEILDKLEIPYAITGGYAISIWGRLRSTFDIDTVIVLPRSKVQALAGALKKISELGYVDEHMVERAVERKGEFNYIHIESGIKVDFWVLGADEFSKSQIQRRVPKNIEGKKVYFVSPEDLILNKLLWYKESESSRQLEDVESVLAIQKKLDWKYMRKWAKKQSTLKILNKLK